MIGRPIPPYVDNIAKPPIGSNRRNESAGWIEANSDGSLLINTIRPYSDRHIIGTRTTSNTTQVIVDAHATWTTTLSGSGRCRQSGLSRRRCRKLPDRADVQDGIVSMA